MKKRIFGLCLCLGLLLGCPGLAQNFSALAARLPGALRAAQTGVFQQGLSGYAGAADTWISTFTWGSPPQYGYNYGQNSLLRLSRGGSEDPLLLFELSSIPSNSAVTSASLSLYNLTPGNCTSSGSLVRQVKLYGVLKGWDEGSLVSGVVASSPGAHGATGDYAFAYYSGGTNLPWGSRGMQAGVDYSSAAASSADVLNPGWYSWDVTALVQAWVRGDQANYGLVLRDATGYQNGNCDWRDFAAAQYSADASLRPKLSVSYNPDVPFASAGPDQTDLAWAYTPLTLDGSASHDRPGGSDASLTYSWSIAQAGFGSALGGVIATGKQPAFTPDVAGEWELELTVTNNLGESASDRVHLRLLSLAAGHPRLYLTPVKLADLRARAVAGNPRWVQLLNVANTANGDMQAKALVSQVTGQASYCGQAITAALALTSDPNDYSTRMGEIAVVYDWCYAQLSGAQRTAFVSYFNTWGDAKPKGEDYPGWGNYWPSWGFSYALMGLASYGDNPRAQEWLDEYRYTRYRDVDQALLDRLAQGGGWPEGMIYDWLANWPRVKALEAWRTATGENLFQSSAWFLNRLPYLLLHRLPGLAAQWGYSFHPYLSTGDTERLRGSIANYERIMALILIERFPASTAARQLQAYLSAAPADQSMNFLAHEEFLWYNPAQATLAPSLLTHFNPEMGTLFMRSGWPGGAADQDPCATYLTFQSGDHFTYHQHYDQNSFTLYRCADLALDSGVYSGNGLSYHDVNYYVRSIAHNTLLVYNPAENLTGTRPGAVANDGGQRSMEPASRYPLGVEAFDQNLRYYDTGDILRFEDKTAFTYVLGDAAKAYNNPGYNQASNTNLSGNTAKLSRYLREFVYLRPAGSSTDEFVVILDRVAVTSAAFSGANTKLLFHTLNQPAVNGSPGTVSPGETLYTGSTQAVADAGSARLFLKTLLPAAHNLRVVGGRGVKAFWVFNANYDWNWSAAEAQPRPVNDFEAVPYGEWRIELEPADTALEHTFLNILYPTRSTVAAMPSSGLVTSASLTGAWIADPLLNRVLVFSAAADGSAPAGVLSYSFSPTAQAAHTLFDLTPGARYNLVTGLAGAVQTVTLTPSPSGSLQASSQGVLSFTLDPTGAPLLDFPVFVPFMKR